MNISCACIFSKDTDFSEPILVEECAFHAAVTAERDALREDAERYKWLRDHCEGWRFSKLAHASIGMDAAIDAARREQK